MRIEGWTCLIITGFTFSGCDTEHSSLPAPGPELPLVTLAADCTRPAWVFDRGKVLNVARGGHGINTDLSWMPGFYDQLAGIGVNEFRIDWLLSDWFYRIVSRDQAGELQYDFSRLDSIILPLLENGMQPLMCMCYMASALGDPEGEPDDYEEYSRTIRAYVAHYRDLGFTGWAWESHNEPEGFTSLTPAQTYNMYRYFSKAVKAEDPTARVGGYGSVGHDWIGYVNSFLDLYKSDPQRPQMDFFSFHQYGKPSWEDVPEIENAFDSRGLHVPELYVTEWNNSYGHGPGEGNLGTPGGGYDTNVNASYVAKKIFNAYGYSRLSKIYFWNFADTDPSKLFAGDMGMFTVDGHKKASANTFYFYNQLRDTIVQAYFSGTGTAFRDVHGMVTVDRSQKKLAILLWNHLYDAVEVKSEVDHLPPAGDGGSLHRVQKMVIDQKYGNYYHDVKNGYDETGTGPHEDPELVDTFSFTGTRFVYTDTLQPHSVVLYLFD